MEDKLYLYIKDSEYVLGEDAIEEIWHYYNHHEFEMCLEGLIIELTTNKVYPRKFNFIEWKSLVEYYKLDTESVFDNDIWSKFLNWGKMY